VVELNPDDGLVRPAGAVSELFEIVRHVQQQTEDTSPLRVTLANCESATVARRRRLSVVTSRNIYDRLD